MNDLGYSVLEGVLSPRDCERTIRALDDCNRGRAGARHLMSVPSILELALGKELLEIARRELGPGAIPYRGTLFEKSGERNWLVVWHQDTTLPLAERFESAEWGPWSTKDHVLYAHAPAWALETIVALRIHLDPSTDENGPLRVLPGSHRAGVLSDEEVFETARHAAPVDTRVGLGGILVMKPLLIHASSKSRRPEPRRVLHLEYAASFELASGIRLARA